RRWRRPSPATRWRRRERIARADVELQPSSADPGVAMPASISCPTAVPQLHAKRYAGVGGGSHRQHNLPEIFVLAHVRLRRYGFVERKAAVDRQPELVRGHPPPL